MFHKYKIIKKELVGKDGNVTVLDLVPEEGEIFDFKPGQYVMLGFYGEGGKIAEDKPFSLCTSPLNKDHIQLAIKTFGNFTQKVSRLKEGNIVGISDPQGVFIFNEEKMKEVIFLAGGIGITPFMSSIRYALEKELDNKMSLIYNANTGNDLVFSGELSEIADKNLNFKVVFSATENAPPDWSGETRRIDLEMLKKYCGDLLNKHFFLCGPPKFIEAMENILRGQGVEEDKIRKEYF